MYRILGAVVGVGVGYVAAIGIAALLPIDTGLSIQNLSILLAATCCGAGAILGFLTCGSAIRQ